MLLVVWPVVAVTSQGERVSVSKSPFEMMELVHDAAGGVVDETVDGERFGTTTTLKISDLAFPSGHAIRGMRQAEESLTTLCSQDLSHDS